MRYLYSAVTGDSDVLHAPGRVPRGWQVVCFSDHETHAAWRFERAAANSPDPVRNARFHKLLPHRFFPDAEISLWIDANMTVSCDLDALVDTYLRTADLAFHAHPRRDCVYEEAVACIERDKDDPAQIVDQVVDYALGGHPRHGGLWATGVVLRRHTEAVRQFNERWWSELESGSRRDQLSAPPVLRELGLHPSTFDGGIWTGPLFDWRPHEQA